MLYTMPNLTWKVYVHKWVWIYSFRQSGTVSWIDPISKASGSGTWKIVSPGKMIIHWINSKSRDEWNVPMSPGGTGGFCYLEEGTYDLRAEAQDYYVGPGTVLVAGGKKYVVYPDEVRSGGTVAWVCRNPGAIRDGDKYGAYPGKKYQTQQAGEFAIFPTEAIGLRAVVSVLTAYGNVTLNQAMHKYAPIKDGNNPDKYAKILAGGLGVADTAYLKTLDLNRLAELITGVETTTRGEVYSYYDDRLPIEVRLRLSKPGPYPPTEEELRNSSLLKSDW